eukprot:gene24163-32581_t
MISLVFVIVTAISAIPTDLTLKLYSGSRSSKLQNCLCATNKAFDTDNESGKHFKVFRNLQPDMFSHPLDKQITRQLSGIPVIASLVRRSLSTVENSFVINNLETTILVSSNQMPRLNASLMKACKILNIKTPPELYIKQNPLPNAYTLAIDGRRPFIVIHTGLMDILNAAEVEAVIGHELGHLKCEHGVWMSLLNLSTELLDILAGPVVSIPLRRLLLQWQRAAEFSCDRAALLVSQDYKVVASVIMKLCGGSGDRSAYKEELNVDTFLSQAEELEKERKATVAGRLYDTVSSGVATHPAPLSRATEIKNWSYSAEYAGLLARAAPARA